MKIIEVENGQCSINSYCPDIEEQALDQMKEMCRLPFTRFASLMPDAHFGQDHGLPIGGVLATENVVLPTGCGIDLGCGMGVVKTSLHKLELEDKDLRRKLLHSFARGIPTGFSHNAQKRINELQNKYGDEVNLLIQNTGVESQFAEYNPVGNCAKEFFSSVGTLGGGNHFYEIQYDQNGSIYMMVHSGSRNLGKRIGDYFCKTAYELNAKWYSEKRDLEIPFLPVDTEEGQAYLAFLDFALKFAFMNRRVMMEEAKGCLVYEFPSVKFITEEITDEVVDGVINIHHNYATQEHIYGQDLWVHRKGAISARNNIGIIPGSMGSSSYITKGLNNHRSLFSSSHGAGRKEGRRQFSRKMQHSYAQIEESLKDVVHSDFGEFQYGKDKGLKDVSECPDAYKNIELVMEAQKDLVEVLFKLKPLICLKG